MFVAALPCETWNVKCVDIQQRHIQFKTDAKCQITALTLSSSLFYIRCSKWLPFARTQAVIRVAHATDLSLRLWRFVQCCATRSTGADTARRSHLRVSRRPDVALQPRSYNQWGSYLGCLGATGWEKWSALCAGALSCWNMKLCNLKWKWTATIIVKYCWRRSCCHASRKYRMTISYSNRTAHLRTGRNRSVACATHHRHFKFHKVVRQPTWGEAKILTSSYSAIPCWI